MPPKKIWNTEVADTKELFANGYEHIDFDGRHFVEDGVHDPRQIFFSLLDRIDEKYPQFKKLTGVLGYIDRPFRRGLSSYSSSLDAMSVIIPDLYDRKRLPEDEVTQNIKLNLLNDFGRMSLNTETCDPAVKDLLETYRKNPTPEFIDFVYDMLSAASKFSKAYDLSGVKRPVTENSNAKNFAVKGMADLIGMSDLVPEVEKAQIWHDGKLVRTGMVYKNNAQHLMQSSDIEYLQSKDPVTNLHPHDNPKTLENITDIGVMFWLSGRDPLFVTDLGYDIDPADGSVRFKLSTFDSPEDFGTYAEENREAADQVLDTITMISRKTAEKILSVNPQAYRKMLDDFGISKTAVADGVARLVRLQTKIAANNVKIVDDWQRQWSETSLKTLADGKDGVEAVGGIYTNLYHSEEIIGRLRLGKKTEPKAVKPAGFCYTQIEAMTEPVRQRLEQIGGGDVRLGYYMLHMAATPMSGLYPGSGKIRVGRIQANLNSLLNDPIETLDTLKLQILKAEAKAKISEMEWKTPAERAKFEQNIQNASAAVMKTDSAKFVSGSAQKWPREKTAIERTAEQNVRELQIVAAGENRTLNAENIRKSYQAVRHLERQLIETLGFFTMDSTAFKTFSGLASLDLKGGQEKSLEEMLHHVQVMSELAKDYAAQYPTEAQKNKNERRARRISLADKLKAVGEACLTNRDPEDVLEDLPEANEDAAADIWYENFVRALDEKGINFGNRMSLALVKEIHDFDYQDLANRIQPNGIESFEQVTEWLQAMNDVDAVRSHVFLPKKADYSYYAENNLLGHLHDNMRDPQSFSHKEKLRLFRLAKENKLCLDLPNPGKEAALTMTMIQVDPMNGCKIGTPIKMNRKVESDREYTPEERLQIKAAGFSVKGFSKLLRTMEQVNSLNMSNLMGLQNIDLINELTPDERKDLNREFCWRGREQTVLTDVVHHPEWFKTKENRDMQNEIYRIGGIAALYRTPEEKKTFSSRHFGGEYSYMLEKSLRKKFGVQKNAQIPFDRIRNASGKPYGASYSYESINAFCGDLFINKAVMIDQKKYVFNFANGKLYTQAPAEQLMPMVKNLLAEGKAAVEQYGNAMLTSQLRHSISEAENTRLIGYATAYEGIRDKYLLYLERDLAPVKAALSQKQNLTKNEKDVLKFANDVSEFSGLLKNESELSAFSKFEKNMQAENNIVNGL